MCTVFVPQYIYKTIYCLFRKIIFAFEVKELGPKCWAYSLKFKEAEVEQSNYFINNDLILFSTSKFWSTHVCVHIVLMQYVTTLRVIIYTIMMSIYNFEHCLRSGLVNEYLK